MAKFPSTTDKFLLLTYTIACLDGLEVDELVGLSADTDLDLFWDALTPVLEDLRAGRFARYAPLPEPDLFTPLSEV